MDGLHHFDESILHSINGGMRSDFLTLVCWLLSTLGVGAVQVVLAASLLCFSNFRRLAWLLVAGWAVSGLAVQLVKSQTIRLRPLVDPETIATPGELLHKGSFPSGHTATSFALAVLVFLYWPGRRRQLVGTVGLILALAVGFSRIYRGVHWPTDVIGGALIGTASALLVASAVSYFSERNP